MGVYCQFVQFQNSGFCEYLFQFLSSGFEACGLSEFHFMISELLICDYQSIHICHLGMVHKNLFLQHSMVWVGVLSF